MLLPYLTLNHHQVFTSQNLDGVHYAKQPTERKGFIRQAAPGVFLDDLQQLHLGHLHLAPLGRAIAQAGAGQVLGLKGKKLGRCRAKVGKYGGTEHLFKSFNPFFRGGPKQFSAAKLKSQQLRIKQHPNQLNEDAERNPSPKMRGNALTTIPSATRSSLMAAAPEPLISLAAFIFGQPVLGLRARLQDHFLQCWSETHFQNFTKT